MNIINLLQLLSEDRTLDNVQKQLEGKVPQKVIDTLSSKMKKGKFDNEAMAIFHGIQNILPKNVVYTKEEFNKKKEKLDYLISHASMVYSILKKLKVGDSAFDADVILDDYINSEERPSSFWKDKYSAANNKPAPLTKEQKKYNTVGLSTARTKDLGDCFAILPKNFKTENSEWGFKELDYNKSHEELKTLSADMAKRDTSGEPGADVNHWCVAASSGNYFNSYKGGNGGWRGTGDFIIFVEKNKDGSPDWNKRYLTWFNKIGTTEIADKFDQYISLNELPEGARNFFLKVKRQKMAQKKHNEGEEIRRRLNDTKDEREIIDYDENGIGKKIVDYVLELARKGKQHQASQIRSYLKKELKTREKNSFVELKNALSRVGHLSRYPFWTEMAGRKAVISEHNGKYLFEFGPIEFEGTLDEVFQFLDKCVADPSLIEKKIDEGFIKAKKKSVPMTSNKIGLSKPTERMIRSLGGNKKIMDKYFESREKALKKEKIGEIFIPSSKSLKPSEGIRVMLGDYNNPNLVRIVYHHLIGTMGRKDDPKTYEKLKKAIESILSGSDDRSWVNASGWFYKTTFVPDHPNFD